MQKTLTASTLVLAIATVGSLAAHHSLGNHDTTTPVRVKGSVIKFQPLNPHSFIFVEQTNADGSRQRWAVEGPGATQLARRGMGMDVLKPGDTLEVCGYVPKERTIWQLAGTSPDSVSISGRLITAELIVMPDGKELGWGDYSVHLCFAANYRDQHSK